MHRWQFDVAPGPVIIMCNLPVAGQFENWACDGKVDGSFPSKQVMTDVPLGKATTPNCFPGTVAREAYCVGHGLDKVFKKHSGKKKTVKL